MKTTKQKGKISKILRITLLSLAGLLIISGISIYLLVHNYINKMHLVNSGNTELKTLETEVSYQEESSTADTNNQAAASGTVTAAPKDNITSQQTLASAQAAVTQEPSASTQAAATQEPIISQKPVSAQETLATQGNVHPAADGAELDADVTTQETTNPELAALDKRISNNISDNPALMEDKEVTNILFIGSDTRNNSERGRSDNMLIISINKKSEKIVATSFLRDIYLMIPGQDNNRLKVAYTSGGAELLLQTIQQNFKIKIDRYIMVDYFSFIDIVDGIGGITLEIKKSEVSKINAYIKEINVMLGEKENKDYLTESGTYVLNGKQALAYSRNRYYKQSDFVKEGKQREVLLAILDKFKSQNLLEMNNVLNIVLPQITTNLTESEIMSVLLMVPSYLEYNIDTLNIPVKGSYQKVTFNGTQVLGIDFKKNIQELYQHIYDITNK
ncbi:MAG TPA: LCP family protein [Mobilitalea sp.]|nr:LCP family protein [Mobilitalea sp.]